MSFANKPTNDVLNALAPAHDDIVCALCMNEGSGTTLDNVGSGGANWDGQINPGTGQTWYSDEGGFLDLAGSEVVELYTETGDVTYNEVTLMFRFGWLPDGSFEKLFVDGTPTPFRKPRLLLIVKRNSAGTDLIRASYITATQSHTYEIENAGMFGASTKHTLIIRMGADGFRMDLDDTYSFSDASETGGLVHKSGLTFYLGRTSAGVYFNGRIGGFIFAESAWTDAQCSAVFDDPYLVWRKVAPFDTQFPMSGRLISDGTALSLSMTANSGVSAGAKFRVYYNTTGSNLFSETPVTSTVSVASGNAERLIASLTGLTTGTQYYYGVKHFDPDGENDWVPLGENGSTYPITGKFSTGHTNIVNFYSDTHIGQSVNNSGAAVHARWQRVFNRMIAADSSSIVFVGDHQQIMMAAYLTTQALWDAWYVDFRNYARTVLDHVPYYNVGGNWDGEGWMNSAGVVYPQRFGTIARKRYLLNPADGESENDSTWIGDEVGDKVGGQDEGNTSPLENYYKVTLCNGLLDLFVLDVMRYTEVGHANADPSDETEWTLGAEQLAWLESALASSTATWKVVTIHHIVGGIGADARGGVGAILRDNTYMKAVPGRGDEKGLHQILKDAGVRMYIYGHDHLFHHGEIEGVHYVQCGTGATFIGTDPTDDGYNSSGLATAYHTSKHYGYMKLEVSVSELTFSFIQTTDDDGSTEVENELYSYTIDPSTDNDFIATGDMRGSMISLDGLGT